MISFIQNHTCVIGEQTVLAIRFFLWLGQIPLINITLFIHSAIDNHVGCFQFLAIINKAAVNIFVHLVDVRTHSLGTYPGGSCIV